jgi:hypothetical protein
MTDNGNALVGHLAWCGLVALHLARRDGIVISPAQETLFLTRWLSCAEKQRRFRKELASDIRWLLKEGREKGVRADLPGKLAYLWRVGSGELLAQNDLYRLQHVLQAVRLMDWVYLVLNENEWEGRRALRVNPLVSGIYLNKNGLHKGFDEYGQQINPILARITGDLAGFDALLQRSGWRRESASDAQYMHRLYAGVNTDGA